jgi:hypothetical protein
LILAIVGFYTWNIQVGVPVTYDPSRRFDVLARKLQQLMALIDDMTPAEFNQKNGSTNSPSNAIS